MRGRYTRTSPRMRRRDVIGARDPAEAVEVLDLLLKFFGDGERWVKGRLSDRRGNRCLVGALDFVSSHHALESDGAERYLADEISAAGITMILAGIVLGIGSARLRLSLAGTVFLILTMGVRTSPGCGRSSSRRARRRWITRMTRRRDAGV